MKNKSFIYPLLSSIDKGSFFREPVSWVYYIVALLSLIIPIYIMITAFNLHIAYNNRESSRVKFGIVSVEYNEIHDQYNEAVQVLRQITSEKQSAYRSYDNARRNAENYFNYYNYGYQQQYEDAKRQTDYWDVEYKALKIKTDTAQNTVQQIEPIYESKLKIFNLVNEEYQLNISKYNDIAPAGAFHKDNIKVNAILALIFFCIAIILFGILNFLLFRDRVLGLKINAKEIDEFVAVPTIAHFIQTIGESIGVYVAVFGFFTIMIAALFDVCFGYYGLGRLFVVDLEFITQKPQIGLPSALLPVIGGFFIIFLFRIISESIKAIVVIANNTRKE
jgi:hypothetical protein